MQLLVHYAMMLFVAAKYAAGTRSRLKQQPFFDQKQTQLKTIRHPFAFESAAAQTALQPALFSTFSSSRVTSILDEVSRFQADACLTSGIRLLIVVARDGQKREDTI
jgi:hypothetical protein